MIDLLLHIFSVNNNLKVNLVNRKYLPAFDSELFDRSIQILAKFEYRKFKKETQQHFYICLTRLLYIVGCLN